VDPLRSDARVCRAESDSAKSKASKKTAEKKSKATPKPPDLPPEPPPAPASPPERTGGLYARTIGRIPPERRSLYASAVLVLLIVGVIIALASRPSHRVLNLLPEGLERVKVLHVDRFFNSAVYTALREADHPVLETFDALEERLDLSLRREISVLAIADGRSMAFVGRFSPRHVRSAFEENVETDLGGRLPQFRTRHVEDYAYTFSAQQGMDRAVTTVGSTLGATGSREFVRRLLKVRAGLYDSLRQDKALRQVYDDHLARVAIIYALEKAGGPRLRSLLPIITPPAAPAEPAAPAPTTKAAPQPQPPAKKEAPRPAPKKKAPANPLAPGKGLGDLFAPGGAAVNPLLPVVPPPPAEAADGDTRPQAAFFALSARGEEVRLGIRIATRDEATAQAMAKHAKTPGPQAALAQHLGVEDTQTVYAEGPLVVIKATLSTKAFSDLAKAHKAAPVQTKSLFLDLIVR
jgi:hypothetical protein